MDPNLAGEYRKGRVFITGTTYVPPLTERREGLHPAEFAAYAHRRLVDSHINLPEYYYCGN